MLNSTHLVGFGTKVHVRPVWIDCSSFTHNTNSSISSVIGPDGAVYFAYPLVITSNISLEVVKIGSNNEVIWKKNVYRTTINDPKLHAISPDGSKLAISTGTFSGTTTDDFGIIQLNTSDGTIHSQVAYGTSSNINSLSELIYNPSGDLIGVGMRGTGTYPNANAHFTKFSGTDLSVTWAKYVTSVSTSVVDYVKVTYKDTYLYGAFSHSTFELGAVKLNDSDGSWVDGIESDGISAVWNLTIGNIALDADLSVYIGFGESASGNKQTLTKFDSALSAEVWTKSVGLNTVDPLFISKYYGEIHTYTTSDTALHEVIFNEEGTVLNESYHAIPISSGWSIGHISIEPNVGKKVVSGMKISSTTYTPQIAILPLFETKEYNVDTDIYFYKSSFTAKTISNHNPTSRTVIWTMASFSWSAGTASPFSIQDSVQTYTPTYLT